MDVPIDNQLNMATKKKKNKLNHIVKGFFIISMFLGAITACIGWYIVELPNVSTPNKDDIDFYILPNDDYSSVYKRLDSIGILKNESFFNMVAKRKNLPNHIYPGKYNIVHGMSNNELVNLFRSRSQESISITFNNIATLNELAGKVSQHLSADSSEFAEFFNTPSTYSDLGFEKETFISMFIPNTYQMYWNTSPKGFVSRMAKEYKSYWNADRRKKAQSLGLSQSQVATLASIVQSETRNEGEMSTVAGLYLNRINVGMKLQADPTVKFATGDPHKKRIYYKDLEIESPYNTYLVKGLPPGPIAMPEIQSMEAVLNRKSHNYYYMCAKPDFSGTHNFANSYNQHLANRKKYTAFLKKQNIK